MAYAGNYATCILDKLPGTQNDMAARAALQFCAEKYPKKYEEIELGSGRGFLSYNSGAECALDNSKHTRSNGAAYAIGVACRTLYDKPNFFNQFDTVEQH